MKKIILVVTTLTMPCLYSQTQPWNTTGNSGTNPATDFIGTTDNQPLIFKTNNIQQLQITSGGEFIIKKDPLISSSTNDNLYFGGSEMLVGERNTVFGLNSFTSNSEANDNVFIGKNDLKTINGNLTGNVIVGREGFKFSNQAAWNVALGYDVLSGKGSLWSNIAIGSFVLARRFALEDHEISKNIGIGEGAMFYLSQGRGNIAIGSQTLGNLGYSTEPKAEINTGNIAIGENAGYFLEKGKNNILIGNSVAASKAITSNELNIGNWIYGKEGDIGIGTQNPQAKFEITGKSDNDSGLRFTKLNANSPTTPNSRLLGVDADGKVVVADNSGNGSAASWSIAGNTGTDPTANFIGTTDNQPLIFRTNNTEQLRVTPKGMFIPQGTDGLWGKSLFFGGGNENSTDGSGRNTVFGLESFTLAQGHTNTAVGYKSFSEVEQATYNVAIGSQTMGGKGWLLENTAMGTFALSREDASDKNFFVTGNSAFGSGALKKLKHGRYNIGIGSLSLFWLGSEATSDEDGGEYSDNIGIGYQAGFNLKKGTNNIFIGKEIKASQDNVNNELNIGNWIFGKDGDIGIGTQSPQAKFEITGKSDNDSGLRFTKLNSNSPATLNSKLLGVDADGKVVIAEGFGNGSGNGWNLTGNTGTDPSVNFIGTPDNQPVLFKTNNEERMRLATDGKVSIGTTSLSCSDCSKFRLFVKDGIRTEKIKVDIASANNWADYVFKKDYQLMPLSEVEKHIEEKGHLPNIPSADEVVRQGLDLGEMNARLLQKIEELTLYQIQMNKEIKELQKENKKLKNTINKK